MHVISDSVTTVHHFSIQTGSVEKDSYRKVVSVILAKNKITADEKRMLRGYR